MKDDLAFVDWPEMVRRIRERTPARLLVGRSGGGYRTTTQLELRSAHAAAVDAVWTELDWARHFAAEFLERWKLFEVASEARTKSDYMLHPNLGRRLRETARSTVLACCQPDCDLQIVIGDGLSVTAISTQVPALLPLLHHAARERGWWIGQSFIVRHCRVGIMNDIGELLRPKVLVLLIGERPGLSTAESLSAYMAYRPREGHSDADRNLISNIHARGVSCEEAARRIVELAGRMMKLELSGSRLKEELPAKAGSSPLHPGSE